MASQARVYFWHPNFNKPLAAAILSSAALVSQAPATSAATFFVGDAVALTNAINTANANGEPNIITVTNDIDLTGITALPVIGNDADDDLFIDLGGFVISGGNATRIFFANAGQLRIANGSLVDGLARGGNGGNGDGFDSGAGGGGMGAGGALFVRNGASVSLDLVTFSGNAAVGGNGGTISGGGFDSSAGGGGGMGGNGGSSNSLSAGGGGGGGALPDYDGGQSSGTGGAAGGGPFGGSGGTGSSAPAVGGDLSGGGGGGSMSAGRAGADGGFGGGGGGNYDITDRGGNGGFGGGGGGGGGTGGGNGGFGGGGGGTRYGSAGQGGFGGGAGGTTALAGGGGAGFGGAVFVESGGTLIITGSGTMAGGAVAGGTGFENGSAAGTGVFLQDSTIEFAPSAGQVQIINDTIADDFANGGGGTVRKTGAGIVELNGINTYGGQTEVLAGLLWVNGSATTATFNVRGGRLGGTGQVGTTNVLSGGLLSPGNSIGLLTVNGDLNFSLGGGLEIEVNAAGGSDLIDVSGTANLAGQLIIVPENGTDTGITYGPYTRYEILHAGTVQGTFSGIIEDFAFLDARLDYLTDPTRVFLALFRTLDFDGVAVTQNQIAAARALSALDPAGPLYQTLLGLSADAARKAYDGTSGEIHASVQHVLIETFKQFQSSLDPTNRGPGQMAPIVYGPEPGTAVASLLAIEPLLGGTQPSISAWVVPSAGRGTVAADGNAGTIDWTSAGLSGGFEGKGRINGGEAIIGGGLGYLGSWGTVGARMSEIEGAGVFAGVYSGWGDGALSLQGSLAVGATHLDTSRVITIGGVSETASAKYWAQSVGVGLEANYAHALTEELRVGPVVALDASWTGHTGFTETGAGVLNATVSPAGFWQADTGIGLAVDYTADIPSGGSVTLAGRLLWQHAFGDVRPDQTLALAGAGAPFSVAGPESGHDRLKLGAGLSFQPSDAVTLSLDYTGAYSSVQQSHAASVTAKVVF